jgi:choline kinase
MKCLILTRGFGRRTQLLIRDRPKASLDYVGKPLISHLLEKVPGDMEIFVSINKISDADFHRW